MHAIDYLALSLFLCAHVATTIAIGLWLNRQARKEVGNAVNNVADGLITELGNRIPLFGGIMAQASRRSQDHQDERVNADRF